MSSLCDYGPSDSEVEHATWTCTEHSNENSLAK